MQTQVEQAASHSESMKGQAADILLIARTNSLAIAILTMPAVLLAFVLLLAPMGIYSHEMTWDLLFDLDGAWRLYNGNLPHVDFHTDLGSLPFAMTSLGFFLLGPNVMGFLVGECLFAIMIFTICIAVVIDRLPLLPAALFTLLSTFIVLMPMTFGDVFGAYSFGMVYNRFGWSVAGILFLLLFVESFDQRTTWKDYALALLLLFALYYIKITYFVVGMAAVGLSIVLTGHDKAGRTKWLGVFAIAALFAVAPFNHSYLSDIVSAGFAGEARMGIGGYLDKFLRDPAEYAVGLTGCLLLNAMRSLRQAHSQTLAGAYFLFASGPLLLSQNAQTHGIPTYAVLCFLAYCAIRRLALRSPWYISSSSGRVWLLLAPLTYPILLLGASSISVSHYFYVQTVKNDKLSVVTDTNLKGLTVPVTDLSAMQSAMAQEWTPALFNQTRDEHVRYELSQLEYVRTILDLSSLLRNNIDTSTDPPRVLMLDRVNAIPFALGLPSPRGVDLWWGDAWDDGLVPRSGEEVFSDVDIVAIPKFSSKQQTTSDILSHYGDYIRQHFDRWLETPDWKVLRRRDNRTQPQRIGALS